MDWIRGERLGHGSFAVVSAAAPRNSSSPLMAVKSCGFSHSSSLMREKLILDELKGCPEIIGCYGESVSYENGEKLYNILLEFASGGSLADKLNNSGDRRLPEAEVRQYTKQLLKALDYIHKFGYVHCDVKLENILLGANSAELKLADFGLARKIGDDFGGELRGTPLYMSPEMVAGGEQGPAADVWAVGCVVVELLSGAPAWRRSNVAGLLMRIGGGEVPEIPDELSEEGKGFLGKIFVKDPRKRWTAEMLLNDPFICDQDFAEKGVVSIRSPRGPLDFPDWVSCSITSLPSPEYSPENGAWFAVEAAERLRGLVSDRCPNWSESDCDDWVTIRVQF